MPITITSDVKELQLQVPEDSEIAVLNIASNGEETSPVSQEEVVAV
jgi:hypothetical protein